MTKPLESPGFSHGGAVNNFPRGFEHATERNPIPRWLRWLAAVMVFAGYGLLEYQDHITEQAIQESRK